MTFISGEQGKMWVEWLEKWTQIIKKYLEQHVPYYESYSLQYIIKGGNKDK